MNDDVVNSAMFNVRLIEASRAIGAAEDDYRHCIEKAVGAERAYKRREAIALVSIEEYRNAAERTAKAEILKFEDEQTVGDLRYAAHLAQGLQDAAKQSLQNRRQELSALQSLASLAKSEAEFIRTAPREAMGA